MMPIREGGYDLTVEQAEQMIRRRFARDKERCHEAFQKFHDEVLPHMDFGSRHAEREFVWEACWRLFRTDEVVRNDFRDA
jgi:hypothetical protein